MSKKEEIAAKLAAAAGAAAKPTVPVINKPATEEQKEPEQEKLLFEGKEFLVNNLTPAAKQYIAHIKDIQTQRMELEKNSNFIAARIVQLQVAENSFVGMLKEQLPN